MDVLTYNGKAFSEFNCFFDGSKAFGTPEKDYDILSVVGKSGDLSIYNNRYKDIELSFPCFIRRDFITNYRNLTAFLLTAEGYLRLETSKEPNYYRKALFLGGLEPATTPFNHGGFFTISFRCHPQRWLKSGEQWITPGSQLFNPTMQTAKPIIRAVGTGTIEIGNRTVTINTAGTEYIDIDCELMDAYEGAVNRNSNIEVDEFPVLHPGNNGISVSGCTITIMPRWYEI